MSTKIIELTYFATPCLLLILIIIQIRMAMDIEAIRKKQSKKVKTD